MQSDWCTYRRLTPEMDVRLRLESCSFHLFQYRHRGRDRTAIPFRGVDKSSDDDPVEEVYSRSRQPQTDHNVKRSTRTPGSELRVPQFSSHTRPATRDELRTTPVKRSCTRNLLGHNVVRIPSFTTVCRIVLFHLDKY
jgi:hypothetical protein